MTTINPYNFVSIKDHPVRSTGYPNKYRFYESQYTGVLSCTLKALSPIVSLDQQNYSSYTLQDTDGKDLKIKKGRRSGEQYKKIKIFKFLRNSQGVPILQGTSLKGMVRSVYEAITDSCLTLATTRGYMDLGEFHNSKCICLDRLCPACRLFGTSEGDNIHCQGRVVFSDASLVGKLSSERHFLKELSSPKPQHHAIYGKNGLKSSFIAGRKFYYHHGDNPNLSVQENQSNDRSIAIDECAPTGSELSFHVQVENLTKEELGTFLLALELHDGLGHKIGLGKALGLGSCRITVDKEKCSVTKAKARYENWNGGTIEDWYSFKDGIETLSEGLIEVLRLNKIEDGNIAYPDYSEYKKGPFNAPIDSLGIFGGSNKKGGRPDWPDEVTSSPPQETPPKAKQDECTAWLKAIYKNKLVFMDTQDKEIVRSRNGYQGKPGLLEVGKWYILSGTNASKRAL